MNEVFRRELECGPADPLLPARPVPPFYDSKHSAWILSRYSDVLAALREPRLSLHYGTGGRFQAWFSAPKLAEWKVQIQSLASILINRFPGDHPIEIVSQFARPCSLAAALVVTQADPGDAPYLERLARRVSESTADPSNQLLQCRAKPANTGLEKYFEQSGVPMGAATFVALSQTLPCFLANAWLALLRHPAELGRVRGRPEMVSSAIEELLRYAGPGRKVTRHASTSVSIGDIRAAEGERAILMLASANRDPEQFPDPNRLDLTRHATGHVAFGAGSHSCAGASLIRMAAGAVTGALIGRLSAAEANKRIKWRGGSGFRWASSLHVLLLN